MNRVTITLHIDLPDGVVPSVDYGAATATQTPVTAPTPISTAPSAPVQIVDGPAGECPKHLRPWKDGKFGRFCSAKDESGPKGYCPLVPGDIWNGKRAAA